MTQHCSSDGSSPDQIFGFDMGEELASRRTEAQSLVLPLANERDSHQTQAAESV